MTNYMFSKKEREPTDSQYRPNLLSRTINNIKNTIPTAALIVATLNPLQSYGSDSTQAIIRDSGATNINSLPSNTLVQPPIYDSSATDSSSSVNVEGKVGLLEEILGGDLDLSLSEDKFGVYLKLGGRATEGVNGLKKEVEPSKLSGLVGIYFLDAPLGDKLNLEGNVFGGSTVTHYGNNFPFFGVGAGLSTDRAGIKANIYGSLGDKEEVSTNNDSLITFEQPMNGLEILGNYGLMDSLELGLGYSNFKNDDYSIDGLSGSLTYTPSGGNSPWNFSINHDLATDRSGIAVSYNLGSGNSPRHRTVPLIGYSTIERPITQETKKKSTGGGGEVEIGDSIDPKDPSPTTGGAGTVTDGNAIF